MVSQSSVKHESPGSPPGGAEPDRGGVSSNAREALLNAAFLVK